jgi:hypothetical protein
MRNDQDDFAQRLYSRLPELYRTRDLAIARQRVPPSTDDVDALNGAPLFSLVRAIAGQVAALRQDMDDLWDNFFIETCDDWVVPYLGSLVGTRLLANPVGQSNRLDVRNTVFWRRSKGTPAMLAALAAATSGWGADVSEFFSMLGWAQNLNHTRPGRTHESSLRDPYPVSRIGHADDPMAHLVDLRPGADLDAPPTRLADVGGPRLGNAGSGTETAGTPGRYLPANVGTFVRRLVTFPTRGVTPANDPVNPARYTFDPLLRELPLYSQATHAPIFRPEFDRFPDRFFGSSEQHDIAIRRHGVLLAASGAAAPSFSRSGQPFTFGDATPGLRLEPLKGLRLMQPRDFDRAQEHFIITAVWRTPAGDVRLGALNTLRAAQGDQGGGFKVDAPVGAAGQLVIRIETGRPDSSLGWAGLPTAGPGRFPATILAIQDEMAFPRAALSRNGGLAVPNAYGIYKDALLAYLPAALIRPGHPVEFRVADDGATYWAEGSSMDRSTVARLAEGQYWPAVDTTRPSSVPALPEAIHRRQGLVIPDATAFSASRPAAGQLSLVPVPILIQVYLGADLRGALATADVPLDEQTRTTYHELLFPPPATVWPRMTFVPSKSAVYPTAPDAPARLSLRVTALGAPGDQGFASQCEVVVRDRAGRSLLVYLPEMRFTGAPEHRFYVADDGSTYGTDVTNEDPSGLPAGGLARVGAGQVQALEGAYPKQCRVLARGRPRPGELWVDPERGRFRLMPADPLLSVPAAGRDLTVDLVEAFSDRIGARAFDRQIDEALEPPSRIVSASGDAVTSLPIWRIHRSLEEAIAAAGSNQFEVIEIADSATYGVGAVIDAGRLRRWVIRGANAPRFERPCLIGPGITGLAIQMMGGPNAGEVELSGLLISNGAIHVDGSLQRLRLTACTLDPEAAGAAGSLVIADPSQPSRAECIISRCVTGGLRLGPGVGTLVAADSIVDRRGGLGIGGREGATAADDAPARHVQLERVTLFGRLRAETLLASESLLTEAARVDDRQAGCLRFSRFDPAGTAIPRRYRCVPTGGSLARGDAATPVFESLSPGRPEYAQLARSSSALLLSASEAGDQVGAFAASFPGLRLANLHAKLSEFLPAGLNTVIIAET